MAQEGQKPSEPQVWAEEGAGPHTSGRPVKSQLGSRASGQLKMSKDGKSSTELRKRRNVGLLAVLGGGAERSLLQLQMSGRRGHVHAPSRIYSHNLSDAETL